MTPTMSAPPSIKLDKPSMEMLEDPMIRAPYEMMRRSHRAAQRQVEKDFTHLQTTLRNLLTEMDTGSTSSDVILAKIVEGGERTSALKRKLAAIQPAPGTPSTLESRIGLVAQLEEMGDTVNSEDPSWQRWSRNRLNRYIIEYLLRDGRFTSAESLGEEELVTEHGDFTLLGEVWRIERALAELHSCTEALAWCGENRGSLKKTNNPLEFTLRLQEYIELCRKRDSSGALQYARKHLAPWRETHFAEIQHVMALLAYDESCDLPAYMRLYATDRWSNLGKEFRQTFNALNGLPSQSILAMTVSAGLSTMKLAACCPNLEHHTSGPSDAAIAQRLQEGIDTVPSLPAAPPIHVMSSLNLDPSLSTALDPSPLHTNPSHPHRNLDCPSCHDSMSQLVKQVPYSHHVNSALVCRMSGKVMDDENYPMAFPNGYVYSHQALSQMAEENYDQVVTCPRTGEQCTFSRLRKVFVS